MKNFDIPRILFEGHAQFNVEFSFLQEIQSFPSLVRIVPKLHRSHIGTEFSNPINLLLLSHSHFRPIQFFKFFVKPSEYSENFSLLFLIEKNCYFIYKIIFINQADINNI